MHTLTHLPWVFVIETLLRTSTLSYGDHTQFHRQTRKMSEYMVRMARSDRVIVPTLIVLSALTLIKDLRVWRR